MKLRPIKTKSEYSLFIEYVDNLFDKKVKPNSSEGEQLQVALLLIKDYEDKHFSIPIPGALDAIRLKMEERGLRNKDLVGDFGSKGYISAVLSGKKPLTLELAKLFYQKLGIPAEVLLS